MRPVLVDKTENRVETLGQRLRKEGRLHIEHLQRFGVDLLNVVNYLQEQGIAHRDIKPDNIAVGMVGRGDTLHVVLFDFSLAAILTDNIRAGTKGYLDPLLPVREPCAVGSSSRALRRGRDPARAGHRDAACAGVTAPLTPRTSIARSPSMRWR